MTKENLLKEIANSVQLLTQTLSEDDLDSLYTLLVLVEKDGVNDVMKRYRQGCLTQFLEQTKVKQHEN